MVFSLLLLSLNIKKRLLFLSPVSMQWVGFGWLLGAHQAALAMPLLSRTVGENNDQKLVG